MVRVKVSTCEQCLIQFLSADAQINAWHFDHEYPIQMTGFNFLENQEVFFLLLFALQRLTPGQWGFIPDFEGVRKPMDRDETYRVDLRKTWEADREVMEKAATLDNQEVSINKAQETARRNAAPQQEDFDMVDPPPPRFTLVGQGTQIDNPRFGLNGRGTGILRGKVRVTRRKGVKTRAGEPDAEGEDLEEAEEDVVLKLSYPEVNRTREKAFIDHAREQFGPRDDLEENPCDYLPTILAAGEYKHFETNRIRRAVLSDQVLHKCSDELKRSNRMPYYIVMPKYEPLGHLTENMGAFFEAWHSIFYSKSIQSLRCSLG